MIFFWLSACLTAEPPDGANSCVDCHGSGTSAAPPVALGGFTGTDYIGVGAHTVHLEGRALGTPVACNECHIVPASNDAEGHVDTPYPAEVKWGELAASGTWDRETLTCSGTYCHGTGVPVWTEVTGMMGCDECHGFPPAGTHPPNDDCNACHAPTGGTDGKWIPGGAATHVDGKVDLDFGGDDDDDTDTDTDDPPTSCAVGCHGSASNAGNPPPDTNGNTATTDRTVGAHEAHLGATTGVAVGCADCHTIPSAVGDAGHIDAFPAEVDLIGLADEDGASPVWNTSTLTCSDTYCHGSTLDGGSNTEPSWVTVDGSQDACGTCHGLPPGGDHTSMQACELCHDSAGPGMTIADPSKHIDGTVDVAYVGGCDSCHGGGGNAAPPPDTSGLTDTTERTVGAHQAHLAATNGASLACGDCHTVPGSTADPGHIDAAPAEVDMTVQGIAANDGASPVWNGSPTTCSNTYCHGSTLDGGSNTEPDWTAANQAGCGSCHGLPPGGGHPAVSTCELCHSSVVGAGFVITDPSKHIDGTVDF